MSRFASHISGGASLVALIAAAGLIPAPAQAQDQTPETVIVTGSHITVPGFQTPTPVTSVSQVEIQSSGALNADALEYQLPALVPNVNYQAVASAPGQTTFNLRGLGSTRTLLLLDGRRVMPTSYDGTTDANILPVSLIKRIDTVTGGASAAYGSDAIAGVVNVILDTTYEGLKGNVSWGQSQYHDADEADISVTGGTSFDGGRGHIVVSAEVYSNSGTDHGAARRSYLQGQWALVPNTLATTANGQPKNLVLPNMQFAQMTSGGLINSGPLKGITFGPGGSVQTFQYGLYANGTSTFMQGGTGQSLSPNNSMSPKLGRQSLFGHVSYDLTPDVTAWGEVSVVHSTAESPVTPNYDNGGLTIHIDNPYLPASVVSMMTANKITTFGMGRLTLETGYNDSVGHYYDVKWDAGLTGKLGNGWTWDATAQYSSNTFTYALPNNRVNSLWLNAVDVVANPAAGGVAGVAAGAPVCRSTIANPTNGCVPTNVFGPGAVTQADATYFDGTSVNFYPQEAWDVSANIQGVLLQDWAGDVSFAVGGEARRDSIHGTADSYTLAKAWRTANVLPFTAHQQVQEGYIETDVPLLHDAPFAKDLDFNGAFRFTNYTLSGNAETWKLGLDWQVTDEIRLRGTNSRDIRAPNLNDLFQTAGSTIGLVTDRATTPNQTYNITAGTGGNPNLLPEVGITNTVGVVYQPGWLEGFQASFDYYNIHLHSAISSPGTQGVVDDCYLYGQTNLCSAIIRNGAGQITYILNSEYNASTIDLGGEDIEADYTASVADMFGWSDTLTGASNWGGSLSLRAFASSLDDYLTTNLGSTVNTAGTGNLPKWKGTLTVTYSNDTLTSSLMYRYTGALRVNNSYVQGVDINNNHIGSRSYFNWSASMQIPGLEHWRVYGNVDNLFNTTPPVNSEGNIAPRVSVSQAYDVIGRTYAIGLRFNY